MASKLNPYIAFDGNAREAIAFYTDVFGGTAEISTFGEGAGEQGDLAEKIMHGVLETQSGFTLMFSDAPPGFENKPGNNISISLSGEDGDELRDYWGKLADGGTVMMPLERQMWGDDFGMVADKFGITWMVNIVGSE